MPSRTSTIIVDGARRRYRERLHMYVAEARFVISRPPASLNLAQLRDAAVRRADRSRDQAPAGHRRGPRAPAASRGSIHNQHPQRKWCEGRRVVICLRSTYKLEGRLPVGIAARQQAPGRLAAAFPTRSNSTASSRCCRRPRSTSSGSPSSPQLDTPPAGALEQSIFYVNQVMQFGKLLAVFQAHPSDPGKTVVSVFTALAIESNLLGKQKQFANVPVLRNLVPAQVLAGQELVQQRQVAQRRAAGLCPQPDPGDRRASWRPAARPPASRRANPVRCSGACRRRCRNAKSLDFPALSALTSHPRADTYAALFGRR